MRLTRQSLTSLWNYISGNRQQACTVHEISGDLTIDKPTQEDKPSAHSSLTKDQARNLINNGFPYSGYNVVNVANTNSMEPFIDSNSLVITEIITPDVLQNQPIVPGDICVYKRFDGVLVLHRVIKVSKELNRIYFQGDNNFFPDYSVKPEQVLYRYIGQVQTRQENHGD